MRLPHHLHLASNGMYRFRLTVPADLQPVFGKQEIIQSLATRDPSTAKTLAYVLSAKFAADFITKRKMKVPSLEEVIQAAKTGRHYELTLPNGTRINVKDKEDHARALEMIGVMEQAGAFKQAPTPAVASNGVAAAKPMPLSGAIKRYIASIKDKTNPKTLQIKNKAVSEFLAWKKDGLLHTVTRPDLADYCQFLQNRQIARPTIHNKFGYLREFFRLMQNQGYYPGGDNPADGQITYSKKDKRARAKQGFEPFSVADLLAIFEPEPYLKLKQPSEYWAPLMGLFTGARVNEICQLQLADFLDRDSQPSIQITDTGLDQSLKNVASKRIVPLHPILIDLGLLDYVLEMEAQGYAQLFPNLKKSINGFGDAESKAFLRHLERQKVVAKVGKKGFHSFRKTIIHKMQDYSPVLAPDIRAQFVGHDLDDEHFASYSRKYTTQELAQQIFPSLKFPVPFHQLKKPANRFNAILKRQGKRRAAKETK